MLRVAEQAFRSDTGRQRTANEDSYFARAPVFAVADGMGGAQAGEVASKLAAEAFEPAERGSEPPETFLRDIAVTANTRIHSLAEHDQSRTGMGTTLTAALVAGDEVSLAHVGDSRAYLLRDDELKLITSDHSLVEELRRQGRLTDEQAEDHPQRSIITRALGPEPEVEVDTMTVQARPGDVFLLCSDGLTTMVPDERIAASLRDSPDLQTAVARLVREANDAGGRDNITVGAFRLEASEALAAEDPGATLVGPTAAEAGLAGAGAGTATAPAPRPRAERPAREETVPRAPRSRSRTLAKALVGLLIVAAVVAGAVYGIRQVYFLGTDEGGRLALYRGLPYDLPFDLELYSEIHSVPVQVSSLPEERRDSATDHSLRSRDDALNLLTDLEQAAQSAAQPAGRGGGGAERQRGSGQRERDGGRSAQGGG